MPQSVKDTFKNKKVLVTGHTGFKGAWLSLWLSKMGAEVIGYSLPPRSDPNLFDLAELKKSVRHTEGDIRDLNYLTEVVQEAQPDIVFHLAAQSLVLDGYHSPQETFATNALGTVNMLEACRHLPSIQAIVVVTTDKCYENRSWIWGYRENDRLGGKDPYSASKAMAELAADAYRESFLKEQTPLATVRCGNVIGGGDFSDYRLLPDCFRALMEGKPVPVRNPQSIRPWLHILDSLYGYLTLTHHLVSKKNDYAGAWNFGPLENNAVTVQQMVEHTIEMWGNGNWINNGSKDPHPEMPLLTLNWEKAARYLNWSPRYCWKTAIDETIDWFKAYQASANIYETCMQQIEKYENDTNPVRRGLSHRH